MQNEAMLLATIKSQDEQLATLERRSEHLADVLRASKSRDGIEVATRLDSVAKRLGQKLGCQPFYARSTNVSLHSAVAVVLIDTDSGWPP